MRNGSHLTINIQKLKSTSVTVVSRGLTNLTCRDESIDQVNHHLVTNDKTRQ